jgi:hypothetical protein
MQIGRFILQVRVLIVIVLAILTYKENDRFPFSFEMFNRVF